MYRPRPAWPLVVGAIGLAVLVNGLLFAFDLRGGGAQRSRAEFPLLPPPPVIGAVWTVLLGVMGYVQARVLRRPREGGLRLRVPVLFATCLLSPAYTAGFTDELRGLAGNLLTLALSAYVAGRLQALTRLGAALIGLVVAWSAFATFATFRLPG